MAQWQENILVGPKNARIYNITYAIQHNIWSNAIDCPIGWHNNKPADPNTGVKRPTVVNMSFQYSWYVDTSTNPDSVSLTGTPYTITGGSYRGITHTDQNRTDLRQYGVSGTFRPDIGSGYYMFGRKYSSIDADVEQLIDNGIHVCTAPGNNYQK